MNVNERSRRPVSEFVISWSFSGGGDLRSLRGDRAFVAAEPRKHGGSPCIHAGEERFSAPKKRRQKRCALALGTS
jgi:hypothetical protein